MTITPPQPENKSASGGIPHWLIYLFVGKMALAMAIVAGVIWWAHRAP